MNAYIRDIGDKGKTLTIEDQNGKTHEYRQGEGREEHTDILHADIMGWPTGALKKILVVYDGPEIPDTLFIRDGSNPGYHSYHRQPDGRAALPSSS